MMKSIQLVVVLLALLHTSTASLFSPVKYNSTQDWSIVRHIYRFTPLIIQSNDRLIHVLDSEDPEHAIHLYSAEYGLCKVPIKLNFQQRYPRRATTLGNGKIVIWLLNYRITHYKHQAAWRFVVVEPRTCKSAPTILAIKDVDPQPVDVVDVVGYYNYFHVFVTPLLDGSRKNIYGYLYNDNGKPIRTLADVSSVIPDLDSHSYYHPNTVRIHTALNHDSADGYFYLNIIPKSRATSIKRFESNFRLIWNTTLKKSTHSYERFDTYSTEHGNLTYCRYTHRSLHCLLLNNLLQPKANLTIKYDQYVDSSSEISRFSVSNTPDGGAFLVFAVESDDRVDSPVYIQKLELDQQTTGPVLFGKFFCEIHHLHSFEMSDGSYCVSVVCFELVHTKCLRLNPQNVTLIENSTVVNEAPDGKNENDIGEDIVLEKQAIDVSSISH